MAKLWPMRRPQAARPEAGAVRFYGRRRARGSRGSAEQQHQQARPRRPRPSSGWRQRSTSRQQTRRRRLRRGWRQRLAWSLLRSTWLRSSADERNCRRHSRQHHLSPRVARIPTRWDVSFMPWNAIMRAEARVAASQRAWLPPACSLTLASHYRRALHHALLLHLQCTCHMHSAHVHIRTFPVWTRILDSDSVPRPCHVVSRLAAG